MAQRLRLAWRQLTFERMKLLTAIAGVMVAVMLMWVQLGILAALYDSATTVHRSLNADLVVFSPLIETLNFVKPISVRSLYRVLGHPDVTAVGELLVGPVQWRNPDTGEQKQIQMYGIDPEEGWLNLPGLSEHAVALPRRTRSCSTADHGTSSDRSSWRLSGESDTRWRSPNAEAARSG